MKKHQQKAADALELLLKEARDTPMGVSQWREQGQKYGYWEYFEREARDNGIKDLLPDNMSTNLNDYSTFEDVAYANGYNDAIKTIRNELENSNGK